MVRYLLTSPELKEHADIHAYDDYGFIAACDRANLEVVRYLLISPELKGRAYIYSLEDWIFRRVCESNNLEIIRFLLTDSELKNTETRTRTLIGRYGGRGESDNTMGEGLASGKPGKYPFK